MRLDGAGDAVTLHIETVIALCFIAFSAGMLAIAVLRDEKKKRLEAELLEARAELVILRGGDREVA